VSSEETAHTSAPSSIAKLPLAAAVVALFGVADAVYLTIHHYTAEPVPCGEIFDCEMVLNSSWAEIAGIPLAAFGAAAYFVGFSLALLTAFGDRRMWRLFGLLTTLMATFSLFLIYLQAFRIHAFCQFCLISAGTTFTLLVLYLASLFVDRRAS
jgi:uncharacterized membrane protein